MEKSVNVVLDLNGLLCVTKDSKSVGPGKKYNHCPSHVLLQLTNGAKVGPKAVSVRRKCFIFVRELPKSAFVSGLNYMKWSL